MSLLTRILTGVVPVWLALVLYTSVFYALEVPKNAVMNFAQPRCPLGWRAYAAAQGRTIVGIIPAESRLPGAEPSTLGGKVGKPLRDLENRQHIHKVDPAAQASFSTAIIHTHTMNHGHGTVYSEDHHREWVHNNQYGAWISYKAVGTDELMGPGRRLDASVTSGDSYGIYGLANSRWYTGMSRVVSEIPDSSFTTSASSDALHNHTIDLPVTSSDAKKPVTPCRISSRRFA